MCVPLKYRGDMLGVIYLGNDSISGLFMETHPNPERALSDGPNSWPLSKMPALLKMLKDLDEIVKPKRGLSAEQL